MVGAFSFLVLTLPRGQAAQAPPVPLASKPSSQAVQRWVASNAKPGEQWHVVPLAVSVQVPWVSLVLHLFARISHGRTWSGAVPQWIPLQPLWHVQLKLS